jgi:hypothetical protein
MGAAYLCRPVWSSARDRAGSGTSSSASLTDLPSQRRHTCQALVRSLIQRDHPFKDKDEARKFFTQVTGSFKNLNYAA